jgi:hypothetical protein
MKAAAFSLFVLASTGIARVTNLLGEEIEITKELIALYEEKVILLMENPTLSHPDLDLFGKIIFPQAFSSTAFKLIE